MRKLTMEELNRLDVQEFKSSLKMPLVLVLDSVRSQHNIGSVFRTADAFRLEKLWLCGITATPPNREINKSALGATESMDWEYHADVAEVIGSLKQQGFKVFALEQAENSTAMQNFRLKSGQKTALVLGNEVNGVSEAAMELVDGCIEIPQFGTKHSLNVSVTAGIVIWHFFLQSVIHP